MRCHRVHEHGAPASVAPGRPDRPGEAPVVVTALGVNRPGAAKRRFALPDLPAAGEAAAWAGAGT